MSAGVGVRADRRGNVGRLDYRSRLSGSRESTHGANPSWFAFCSPNALDSPTVAVLLFCQCGSDRVDIKLWNVRRAQIHCLTCGQEAWLDGFTVSEFEPAKLIGAALVDQARKHRKRSPEDTVRVQEHRKAGPQHGSRR